MAKVIFTADFDYKPTRMVTIAYRAGQTLTVKREAAEQAVAAGKAEWVKAPRAKGEPEPADATEQ